MFDVSFPELVLVFVIALLVLGPQRLPKVAAEIGKWVGRARRTANQLRRQLEREIELSEITRPPPAAQPPPQAPQDVPTQDPYTAEAQHGHAQPQAPLSEAPPDEQAAPHAHSEPVPAPPDADTLGTPSQPDPVHTPPHH